MAEVKLRYNPNKLTHEQMLATRDALLEIVSTAITKADPAKPSTPKGVYVLPRIIEPQDVAGVIDLTILAYRTPGREANIQQVADEIKEALHEGVLSHLQPEDLMIEVLFPPGAFA